MSHSAAAASVAVARATRPRRRRAINKTRCGQRRLAVPSDVRRPVVADGRILAAVHRARHWSCGADGCPRYGGRPSRPF